MEKVKVNKVLFEKIGEFLKLYDNDYFIRNVCNKGFSIAFKELNGLSSEDAAKIVALGYELEKTPEEKILELYKLAKIKRVFNMEYNYGYIDGIKTTLDKLNIKIEGIN